jgi:putative flippase GtrA
MGFVRGISPRQVLRFFVVGVGSNVVYFGLWYVLVAFCGVWYLTASVIASFVHILTKFVLQKIWAFENRELRRTHYQLGFYFCMEATNLVINTGLLYVLVQHARLGPFFAQCIVGVLLSVETFLITRWIFKPTVSTGIL